jgi:hypothetical protein
MGEMLKNNKNTKDNIKHNTEIEQGLCDHFPIFHNWSGVLVGPCKHIAHIFAPK